MNSTALSTTDRILEASLKLFNEHGLPDVPALRIATHLGISPGHLAYHFKSKDDIVGAVFARLEAEMREDVQETKKPADPFLPSAAVTHQIQVFRTLWRFRFFFNALTQLLTNDRALRARFMKLQDGVLDTLGGLFEMLIAEGYMNSVQAPNSTRVLAKGCWMMWLSWLRFEQIENPHRESARNAAIYEGVVQNFIIVQPYFSREFAEEMLAELRKALPDDEETSQAIKRRRTGGTPAGSRARRRTAVR